MIAIDAPESISRDKVLDFVRSLGVDPNRALELVIGIDRVELRVIAYNSDGKIVPGPDGRPAEHVISLEMR